MAMIFDVDTLDIEYSRVESLIEIGFQGLPANDHDSIYVLPWMQRAVTELINRGI